MVCLNNKVKLELNLGNIIVPFLLLVGDISDREDIITKCVCEYYDIVIVLVGNNDLASKNFSTHLFIQHFKRLILQLNVKLGCRNVILLGFLPRAYCRINNCNIQDCMYIHRGFTKIPIVDIISRIYTVNKNIDEFIKYDERFRSFRFINYFSAVTKLGTIDDGYGNFLSIDGLHLSKLGNKLLDTWLTRSLGDMELCS